jgi:hypothetical protein
MTASSLTPLTRTTLSEHRAELARQRRVDMENAEQTRMRHERELAHQRGELRERERRLEQMEWRLEQERVALQADLDAANTARAESMLTDDGPVLITRLAIPQSNAATMATAAAIIRAAAIARGEIDDTPQPTHPTARAVILSGMRARGEALSASDAQWLENFCRRTDAAGNRG